jgi:hypothetical protein
MIQKQSDDPDVEAAAGEALKIIKDVLDTLPKAETFDYGGHQLRLGEYDLCLECTSPIAEAQQAQRKLLKKAETIDDETVREHVELAAEFFRIEAEQAQIRAELHNGQGTESIINELLGFKYARRIEDSYEHSHQGGR